MTHTSRIPLPSIALVLTTDHARVPRRPSVIRLAALPPPPSPTKTHKEPQDLMKTIDMRVTEPQLPLVDNCTLQDVVHGEPATAVEEDEPMALAGSIHEAGIADVAGSVKTVFKDKISNALFSFHRMLCVGLPNTCIRKIARQ